MSAPDAGQALIDHALALEWPGLPVVTRSAAVTFLHDTLAVGAAGVRAAHADAVLAMVQGWGSGGQAGVLGRPGLALPAASAAFVNAFQIHGQEYDCVHEAAVLHPMATVGSALLAELGRGAPVSGSELLTAIVAGVDVAVALGLATTGPLTFFRPATAGVFGSVAAIARLRRLPRERALDAFGHALALASGTMQAHVEGKPALAVQVANAARNALVAIDLAQAGLAGVRRPIEGPFGYAALFESSGPFDLALAKLGQGHRIEELSWKPFPTGRAAQGCIVAIQTLLARGIPLCDIVALEYAAPPLIARLVGRPATADMTAGYARLCLPWLAAVTLERGTVSLADFTPERLADPALLARTAELRVVVDGNADPAAFVPARLFAQLSNGAVEQVTVEVLLGSPDWPLTPAQHRAKMRECLSFAGLAHCDAQLAATLDALPGVPDALQVIRATGLLG